MALRLDARTAAIAVATMALAAAGGDASADPPTPPPPSSAPSPAPSPDGPSLSFDAARERLFSRSDSLAAARSGLRASQDQADAVKLLGAPSVFLDAQVLRYRKTLDLSLDPAKQLVQSSVDGFLAALPDKFPSAPPGLLGQIGAGIDQQVSGALGALPGSARLQTEETLFRPTVAALAPLYTGGLIDATRDAAKAGVRQADAELTIAGDEALLLLVQAYFGQQLAAQVLRVSTETRDGFDLHLRNAEKLEREGFISKAQRLQVQVARDAAARQYERAVDQYATARSSLAILLREPAGVAPATPMFVNARPIGPEREFVDAALAGQPLLRKLDAVRDQARQGVRAAQAAQRPSVYGFAEYNLNRGDALLVEPDWIVGLGVHYTLFSGLNRGKAVSAARQRVRQADSAVDAARAALETAVVRARGQAETARRQYGLLAVNIEAARESVRVNDLAFREGQATAAEVVDARVALSVAETQRAAAAYEYDLALAQLLAASGRLADYADYIKTADKGGP